MLHSIVVPRLPYVHMLCRLRDGLGWCYLSLADVTYSKCTILGWWSLSLSNVNVAELRRTHHKLWVHALDDVACRSSIFIARCAQTTSDAWISLLIHHVDGWCHLAKACMTWPMSPNRCTHATDDAWRPWLILPAIGWCRMDSVRRPGLMYISRYAHTMTDVCTYLLLLPSIGRCAHAIGDVAWLIHSNHGSNGIVHVHITWRIHEGLNWCCVSSVDVIFQMRTCHNRACMIGWCCMPLSDVTFQICIFHVRACRLN